MPRYLLNGVSAFAIVVAAGAVSLESPAAVAADGPYDWAGIYAGVHVGYGEQKTRFFTDSETVPQTGTCQGSVGDFCSKNTTGTGAVFGAQVGLNFQQNNFVYGIEGDASWAGLDSQTTSWCCTARANDIDTLVSLRGRLGFAFDRVLVYGTGGIGYVGATAHKDGFGRNTFGFFTPVVGGGVAWAYNDRFSFRVEGLDFLANDVQSLSDDHSIHTNNVWVARIGLDFKLGSR